MPVPFSKFEAQRDASQAGVREFSRQIASRGATKIILGDTYHWDIKWNHGQKSYTGEIKEDLAAERTGNVAIEVSCRGKRSGLYSTRSNYYIYLIRGDYYMIRVSKLKSEVASGLYRKVWGGDDKQAELYLIPIHRFCALCIPLFVNVPPYLLSQFK